MHLGLLAWTAGTLLVIAALVVGFGLAAYAVWYLYFRLGKSSTGKGGHVHLGLLAWTAGTLIAIACIILVGIAVYSIWYIFARLGK
jgi:heme/copper-type cytochrome/quinol oxidase subunit 2